MTDQEKAISAASKWALRYLMLPGEFKASIQGVEQETQFFSKVQWHVRKRQIVVKQEPTAGISKLEEPISPDLFDPWKESTESLREKTPQVTTCETCNGEKKVTCPICNGSSYTACEGCMGSGSAISEKTGNAINCRKCKGMGQKKCKCKTGLTKCLTCDGKGKANRWLEVEESYIKRVENSESNLVAHALSSYSTSTTFVETTSQLPLTPVSTWSGTDPNLIPADMSGYLQIRSTNPLHSKDERLERIDIQLFSLVFFQIVYQTAWKRGRLAVSTEKFKVTPGDEAAGPLKLRRNILLVIGFLAFISGLVTVGAYTTRHDYFSHNLNSSLLTVLAFLYPCMAIPPAAVILSPNWSRYKNYMLGLLGIGIAFILFVCVLFFTGNPSIKSASAFYQTGKLDNAMREARACIDLQIDRKKAEQLHDMILLDRVAGKPKDIFANMNKRFFSTENKARAENKAFALITNQLRGLHRRHTYGFSEVWLSRFPNRLRSYPTAKRLLLEANINLAVVAVKRHRPDLALARLSRVPPAQRDRKDFKYALAQTYLGFAYRCAIQCDQTCFFEYTKKAQGVGFEHKDLSNIIGQFNWYMQKNIRSLSLRKRTDRCLLFTKNIAAAYNLEANVLIKELYHLQAKNCIDQLNLKCLKTSLKNAGLTKEMRVNERMRLNAYALSWVIASIRKRGRTLRPNFTIEEGAEACKELRDTSKFFFKMKIKQNSRSRWVVDFEQFCQGVTRSWRSFKRGGLYRRGEGSVVCNDGSFSSCSCNKLRGCCSHHKGVRGCEYTRYKRTVPVSPVHFLWKQGTLLRTMRR